MSKEYDQSILTNHYTKMYKGDAKHDSPEQSRITMIRAMVPFLKSGIFPNLVLNIGAGRQSLEKQLLCAGSNMSEAIAGRLITLDTAAIEPHMLLARRSKRVFHTRADAIHLPFTANAFGMIVSNLAIDFLPHDAFAEVARVLAPRGFALFNFHHPSLYAHSPKHPAVREFWNYLQENNILFRDEDHIRNVLRSRGLNVHKIQLYSDKSDRWWHVTAETFK